MTVTATEKNSAAAQQPEKSQRTMAGLGKALIGDFATRSNLGLAAGAAVVGLLGLNGGLDPVQPEAIVSLTAARETVDAEPFEINIGRSYMADGARVIELQLLNTAKRPVDVTSLNLMFALEDPQLEPDAQPKLYARTIRLTEPAQPGRVPLGQPAYPNPDVPIDVLVVFDGAPESATTLVINSLEYRTSFLDGTKRWFTKDRAAEVQL